MRQERERQAQFAPTAWASYLPRNAIALPCPEHRQSQDPGSARHRSTRPLRDHSADPRGSSREIRRCRLLNRDDPPPASLRPAPAPLRPRSVIECCRWPVPLISYRLRQRCDRESTPSDMPSKDHTRIHAPVRGKARQDRILNKIPSIYPSRADPHAETCLPSYLAHPPLGRARSE